MPTARPPAVPVAALLAAFPALLAAAVSAQSLVPSIDAAAGAPPPPAVVPQLPVSPAVVPQTPETGPGTAPGATPIVDWSGWSIDWNGVQPNYQGNVNPGIGGSDYSWQLSPGLDMVGDPPVITVSPGLPGAETFQVQCVTPAGYCDFTSDTSVAAGLPCYCNGSNQPGVTR